MKITTTTTITSISLVIALSLLLSTGLLVSGNNNIVAKKNARPFVPPLPCDLAKDPICNLPPPLWFKA
jgi:hypothetical protein